MCLCYDVAMNKTFRRICIYCGSSNDVPAHYLEAARNMGRYLAEAGIGLVYGGGRVGLMGEAAAGALEAGGEVLGVITDKLMALEVGHQGLTELYIVDSMHARKMMMAQLSDAFIALPGGFGTMEELFEVTTWAQLNYHLKPVGLLNVDGYYDHLIAFLKRAGDDGFIRDLHQGLIQVGEEPGALIDTLRAYDVPKLHRWIQKT